MPLKTRFTHLAAIAATGLLGAPHSHAAELGDLRMWQAPDHTRLVFDLDSSVDHELFTLEDPLRVVVDMADSRLRGDLPDMDFSGSPIAALRHAEREDGSLRVVLDMNRPTRPRSFVLAPNSEFGDRLVVDLYEIEPLARVAPVTRIEAPDLSDGRRDIVVAISAGHGGEDTGGIGYDGRIQEKNVTLAISRALRDRLEAEPGYRPVMIRDGDYYVELRRRPQIAREHRADLFLAIHADWYRNSQARGVTIYALSGDRADRENARRVAEKENSTDLLGGVGGDLTLGGFDDDVALTLVDLQMDWSMHQGQNAGTWILESLGGITRLRRDKVQQASLQVLNSPDIPSLLIETGYLTNPDEARRLDSADFQRRMADAIARGVMAWFNAAPPEGTLVAWQQANGITPASWTVTRGDTLSEIAARFGIDAAELKAANGLTTDTIRVGQVLTLPGSTPGPASEHIIRPGETLSEIAARYGVSLSGLRRANKLSGDRILVGQVLKIPGA